MVLYQSLQPAQAYPPFDSKYGISSSDYPYESFSGVGGSGNLVAVLTVPNDKIFVVTSVNSVSNHGLYEDNTLVFVDGTPQDLFRRGKAHLKISPGSTLKIENYSQPYYLEGYYAAPNNCPYENFTGLLSANQTIDLLVVPNDKVFVITGGSASIVEIDLYEDSTLVLDGTAEALYTSTSTFQHGNGHLMISAGSTLKITSNSSSNNTRYYIEGYYAPVP